MYVHHKKNDAEIIFQFQNILTFRIFQPLLTHLWVMIYSYERAAVTAPAVGFDDGKTRCS